MSMLTNYSSFTHHSRKEQKEPSKQFIPLTAFILRSTSMRQDRRGSLREEIERLGSMDDLWVIFELPMEDSSEKDLTPGDADFISMLSHSQSDYSLQSLMDHSRHSRQARRTSLKCKRVDTESPLHRSNCGESTDTYDSDDYDSDCTFSVESYASTICYYSGDRWSPCHSARTTVQSVKTDVPPHTPKRTEIMVNNKSDQTPRIPCRTQQAETTVPKLPPIKLDRSPRIPRRMATDSVGDSNRESSNTAPGQISLASSSGHRQASEGSALVCF